MFEELNKEFEENGYVVIRNALHPQTIILVRNELKMVRDCFHYYKEMNYVPDDFSEEDTTVPNAFSHYAPFCSESLSLLFASNMEKVVNKRLIPTFSYYRIMYNGAYMKKHTDRPTCQYSASICISQETDHVYPLYMKNYKGETRALILFPGDMVVYHGTKVEHWRDVYEGNEHIQTFIHYVDVDGPYAKLALDGRQMMGLPTNRGSRDLNEIIREEEELKKCE